MAITRCCTHRPDLMPRGRALPLDRVAEVLHLAHALGLRARCFVLDSGHFTCHDIEPPTALRLLEQPLDEAWVTARPGCVGQNTSLVLASGGVPQITLAAARPPQAQEPAVWRAMLLAASHLSPIEERSWA